MAPLPPPFQRSNVYDAMRKLTQMQQQEAAEGDPKEEEAEVEEGDERVEVKVGSTPV
jgi:hypothetical protein